MPNLLLGFLWGNMQQGVFDPCPHEASLKLFVSADTVNMVNRLLIYKKYFITEIEKWVRPEPSYIYFFIYL